MTISSAFAAVPAIPFTVTMSESINVTGTPRLVLDVGGNTRYAMYTSGTGTASLTFTYTATTGDVDLDGIGIPSALLDLNGGTVSDLQGNSISNLTFTAPANLSSVHVNYPSLSMDFIYDTDGRYTLNGTVYNDLTSFLTAAGGTFSRASVGTYYDSSGYIQTAASGVPRFNYDPVTHAAKGILIESSTSNQYVRSMEFNHGAWVKGNATVTANQINGPDNSLSAEMMDEGVVTSQHYAYQLRNTVLGNTYTMSLYAKAGTGNLIQLTFQSTGFSGLGYANFNLSTGTVAATGGTLAGYGIVPLVNGWYRCYITATATATAIANRGYVLMIGTATDTQLPSYTGTSKTVYLWGGQYEINNFPSSFIPTTTAIVTRAADNLTVPTGSWYNASAMSIYADIYQTSAGAFPSVWAINDGTTNNELLRFTYTAGLFSKLKETTGGVTQFDNGITAITFPLSSKTAVAFNSTQAHVTENGGSISTFAGTLPSGLTTLRVGSSGSGGNYTESHIRTLKYYPLQVSDPQLQLMTQ